MMRAFIDEATEKQIGVGGLAGVVHPGHPRHPSVAGAKNEHRSAPTALPGLMHKALRVRRAHGTLETVQDRERWRVRPSRGEACDGDLVAVRQGPALYPLMRWGHAPDELGKECR
jgi:hypothetical protein